MQLNLTEVAAYSLLTRTAASEFSLTTVVVDLFNGRHLAIILALPGSLTTNPTVEHIEGADWKWELLPMCKATQNCKMRSPSPNPNAQHIILKR